LVVSACDDGVKIGAYVCLCE